MGAPTASAVYTMLAFCGWYPVMCSIYRRYSVIPYQVYSFYCPPPPSPPPQTRTSLPPPPRPPHAASPDVAAARACPLPVWDLQRRQREEKEQEQNARKVKCFHWWTRRAAGVHIISEPETLRLSSSMLTLENKKTKMQPDWQTHGLN